MAEKDERSGSIKNEGDQVPYIVYPPEEEESDGENVVKEEYFMKVEAEMSD